MIPVETSIDLVRIVMKDIGKPEVLSLKEIEEVAKSVTEIVKDWKHDRKLTLLAKEGTMDPEAKEVSDRHRRRA